MLISGGLLLAVTGCHFGLPFMDRKDPSLIGGEPFPEEPLESGGGVHALETPTGAAAEWLRFSPHSRFYAWGDSAKGTIMGTEIGGSTRELAPFQGRWLIDWSADGQKFLVKDLAAPPQQGIPEGPYRGTLYTLAGGPPVSFGTLSDPSETLLPDGSGLSTTRRVESAQPAPGPVMASPSPNLSQGPKRLTLRMLGQPEREEALLATPGVGYWSHDAQHHAYLAYREGDPLNGLELRVHHRQSKTSTLLYHIESDNLQKVMESLSWSTDQQLWYVATCQKAASASIAVSTIPLDGRGVNVTSVPLSLEEGESIDSLHLAPDQTRIAVVTSRVVTLSDQHGRMTGPRSTGISVVSLKTGKMRRLTPRGRVVNWLPGGNDLVASTGQLSPRYYRIDVPRAEEL
jgi:hypothetical protein